MVWGEGADSTTLMSQKKCSPENISHLSEVLGQLVGLHGLLDPFPQQVPLGAATLQVRGESWIRPLQRRRKPQRVPAQTLDQDPTNMERYSLPSQSKAGSKLIQQA